MGHSEKEAVKWIKQARKQGLSNVEIKNKLLKQDFKLEYIEKLVSKSHTTKKTLISLLLIIIFISGGLFLYIAWPTEHQNLENPLQQLKNARQNASTIENLNINEIEITSEFISYLLDGIGASNLKKNPLTQERAKIKTIIENKTFTSTIISGQINTTETSENKIDIIITTEKQLIIEAILSEDPKTIFKNSFQTGESQLEIVASETDLFAKGYLKIYNELSN